MLLSDTRCPMCDTKQRTGKNQPKEKKTAGKEKVIDVTEKRLNKNKSKGVMFVIFLSIGILTVSVSLFLLILNVTQAPERAERADAEVVFSEAEVAFINQANTNTGRILHMTQTHFYVPRFGFGRGIEVFDYQLNHVETLYLEGGNRHIIYSLHVTEEAAYFTNFHDALYRHDFTTRRNQLVTRHAREKRIVDNHLVHFGSYDEPGIFTYNLEAGEEITISDVDNNFSPRFATINPLNNRLMVFISDETREGIYEMDLDGENKIPIIENTGWRGFILSDRYLAWIEGYGFYLYERSTSERTFVNTDFSISRLTIVDNQIFMTDWEHHFFHTTTDNPTHITHVANDVWRFSVAGDFIVFEEFLGSFNLYVMNFDGTGRRILVEW